MLRRLFVALFLTVSIAACGGGASADRTVLVDYTSEEFATSVFANFPAKVDASPGQTIEFKQAWTGEPHTVTGGASVNKVLADAKHWVDFFHHFEELAGSGAEVPNPDDPGAATFADFVNGVKAAENKRSATAALDALRALQAQGVPLPDVDNPPAQSFGEFVTVVDEESTKAFDGVPFVFDEEGEISQNVGQPCYKRAGALPLDAATPCAKSQQRQPSFDGKQSIYNSGLIRYEGVRGNSFKVKLADDIDPGKYFFYCAVHGFSQMTELEVKEGDEVESRREVARRGRAEAERGVRPLERVYREAVRRNTLTVEAEKLRGPFAGLIAPGNDHALINEFVPRRIQAKVNEPITWKAFGSDHTISFDVPPYFPILQFDTPKGVRLNPRLSRPAGGAPPLPPHDPQDDGKVPLKIDGGTYDGSGFWSSGLFGADPYAEYTIRISKPGTYPYACLIHPPMIGQIVVS